MEKPTYAYLLMKCYDYEPSTPIGIYWTLEDAIEKAKGFVQDEDGEDVLPRLKFKFVKTENGANFIGYGVSFSIEKIEEGMTFANWRG